MSLKVVIPTPLRKHTGGAEVVEVDAGTVKEVLDRLESKFPGLRGSVCDDNGSLRRFINIYVDGEDVRFLQNLSTPAKDGSEIAIVPAISGGAGVSENFEIGRIQNLKSEIRNFKSDKRRFLNRDFKKSPLSNLKFRISDLRCRIRPISKFPLFRSKEPQVLLPTPV